MSKDNKKNPLVKNERENKKQKRKSSKSENVIQKTDSKVIDINKNKKFPGYKPRESILDHHHITELIKKKGKIPKKEHREILSLLNLISKDFLGEGAFVIDDFKLSEKFGSVGGQILTLNLNKTNTATDEEIKQFLDFNRVYSKEADIRNNRENFELDIELVRFIDLDPKNYKKEYSSQTIHQIRTFLLERIVELGKFDKANNDRNETILIEADFTKDLRKYAREKDIEEKFIFDLTRIFMDELSLQGEKNKIKGKSFKDFKRNSEEIQKAFKNEEFDLLYKALFRGGLINRKVFDQLIKDRVNLHSITEGFRYRTISAFVKEDIEAQKLEMQGGVLLVYGKLNEASELFEKAYETLPERYDFDEDLYEVPYGAILYGKLAFEFVQIDKWNDGIKYYDKALGFLNYHGHWEIDALKEKFNTQIKILQKIIFSEQKIILLEKQERVRSLEKRMKKLVAQYSHTLGNTLFPENIYNVAGVLKNHKDFRNESLILKKAYHAEVLVKHQAEMLRIKHGSDTGEEFQRLILKDRLQEDSKEDAVNIIEILGYAAERVVERLLNQNYVKIKDVRDKLVKKSGMDIDELRNDFENKVFFDQKQTSLNWINDKLAKLEIGKMSPTWGNILIRKDSYTHALLQGHWGEILFNAFKYANHSKKDFLTIKFEEHVEKEYTWLQMVWENPCKKTDNNHGGEGLEGITEDLMQLNKTEDEKFSLYSNNKKNNFQVNLFYRSDMLTSPKEDLELVENYFD